MIKDIPISIHLYRGGYIFKFNKRERSFCMKKAIYIAAVSLTASSILMGGCSKKDDKEPETTVEESSVDSNHTPYVEMEPDENPPELIDRPYFESYESIDEIIEREAKEELKGKVGSPSNASEASETEEDTGKEPEYVIDSETGDIVEKKTVVSGDTAINIARVEAYTVYDSLNDVDRTGTVLYLDDYDIIDLDPNFSEAGASYTVEGNKIKFNYPDGRYVEYVKLGSGFTTSKVLTASFFNKTVASVFGEDTTGFLYTEYNRDDMGPEAMHKMTSADLKTVYKLYRGSNGVYIAKFTGDLPYRCQELEVDVALYTLN